MKTQYTQKKLNLYLFLFLMLVLGSVFVAKEKVSALLKTTVSLIAGQTTQLTCTGGTFRTVALDQTGLSYELHCDTDAPTPPPDFINRAVCNPTQTELANWSSSLNITNPYLPMPVGLQNQLEGGGESVRVTVTDQTEVVAGVTTRVVEEYEQANGVLKEISYNYFAQSPTGEVCYFGEHVDIYSPTTGQIISNDGSWRAGDGANMAGIIMPAQPVVGQKFRIEDAPGIAFEDGEILGVGTTLVTPAGTLTDVVNIKEQYAEISLKDYARGIGMVKDNDMVLVTTNATNLGGTPQPTPSTSASPVSDILPPPGEQFDTEELITYDEMTQVVKDKLEQLHPQGPNTEIIEIKYETYSNGAQAYAIEYVINGARWDVGITVAGTVFRDELEINP